jgi:hypothetical protein
LCERLGSEMSSRKDYVAVAAILAGEYALNAKLSDAYLVTDETVSSRAHGRITVENITASVADVFASDNPRFDREKFYRAALGRDSVRENYYAPYVGGPEGYN